MAAAELVVSVAELAEVDNVVAKHVPEEESEKSVMETETMMTTLRMMVTTTTTILF